MKATVIFFAIGLTFLAASAEDLAWKPIESHIGRSASVTKSVSSTTAVDGRTGSWFDSLPGMFDTFAAGLIIQFY